MMAEDNAPTITMRCPRCGSDQIKIPLIQAPKGYAFDSTLVLVTCAECGHRPKMTDATRLNA